MPKACRVCQPVVLALLLGGTASATPADLSRYRSEAAHVTITRDTWGIAHVHGVSDADAVFGAIYAQAEDDYGRIVDNYRTALGRRAEVHGQDAVWSDLRERLFLDPADLRRDWLGAPEWLKALTVAWADALNFYQTRHTVVDPFVFEPWMALAFSEGSIGGDIESVDLKQLAAFYGGVPAPPPETAALPPEPTGSNGIAIAPKLTRDGHALLLINPHTSFFFRSELQMTSDAGLDAYGAATWGQFFLYQGFNRHLGWMHTSSTIDAVDEFAEAAGEPATRRPISLRVREADGSWGERRFVGLFTRHGPVVRKDGYRLVAVSLMNRPVAALEQSFLRTRAGSLGDYLKVAELKANSSNNTVYADNAGHIAYLHPQFAPTRDDRLDWTKPVDGSTIDWGPPMPLAKLPHVIDPDVGWIANTNDWPWTVAGPDSPKAADFPRTMDHVGELERGLHAQALLTSSSGWTPERLIAAAYDSRLPAFERLVPLLVAAWEALPATDPQRTRLAEPVAQLRGWDRRWSAGSTETTLAVFWGEALFKMAGVRPSQQVTAFDALAATPAAQKLAALDLALARLNADFGRASVPWGEVNRFQRVDDAISAMFHDDAASIPVPFTSALWGSLASFGTKQEGTTRRYGTSGNSFVAVVEFGPRVRAWAITAGGESGDPKSPHFADQAARYAAGALRPIWFYPEDIAAHAARTYRPGG